MLQFKNKNVYRLRLRSITLAEIFYRFKEWFLIFCLRNKFLSKNHNSLDISKSLYHKKLSMPSLRCNISEKNIAELLNGKIFSLNANPDELNLIEKRIGKIFFSAIDWRNKPFDIRSIWEPARLQNITTLLVYTNNNPKDPLSDKIRQFCLFQISRWIQKNPFLYGPHYISVMECGLRIPVLFYCLKLIDDIKQIKIVFNAIFLHGWWISKRLSLYSSLGNHTIAESVGLIFAGSIFYDHKKAKRWLKKGIQILKKELSHQFLEDGGPAEQSFHYHRFVLDLYWLAIDFLEKNNLYDCLKLKSRLIRAEKFLLAFQAQNGNVYSIGDSDDGFAIAPMVKPKKPIINYMKKKIRIFKNSGYTIINSANRIQLIFDHGPLGMPPLYNHGHADALSIILNINGKQILVDPGTYKYNGAPEWRRYFKGTRAHNTITIDGFDQSVQETGFIWSHPYNVELLGFSENADQFLVNAMHDGYERLEEPVRHKRDILFFDNRCFLIKDSFVGKGVHEFEINFHLHPNVDLIKQNSWWQIKNEDTKIYIRLIESGDFVTICGSKDPIHGWYSPSYGTRFKCNVMSCKKKGSPREISFVTAICTEALIDMKKIQDKFIYFD